MLLKNKLSSRRLFFGGRILTDYSVRLKALFYSPSFSPFRLIFLLFPLLLSLSWLHIHPILPNSSEHLFRSPYTSASFLSTPHPPQHTKTCPSGLQTRRLYFFFIFLHHIGHWIRFPWVPGAQF